MRALSVAIPVEPGVIRATAGLRQIAECHWKKLSSARAMNRNPSRPRRARGQERITVGAAAKTIGSAVERNQYRTDFRQHHRSADMRPTRREPEYTIRSRLAIQQ